MSNQDRPKMLDPKLDALKKLFFSYFHSYMKRYFELAWLLEESKLLLRTGNHTTYNTWQLNQSLYGYAEISISSLSWLCGSGFEHPFVHQFLRRWRNKYHHESRIDIGVYDFSYTVDGVTRELQNDYYICPNVESNEMLRTWLREWFPDERVSTDATVGGLVRHHHRYMLQEFVRKEAEINASLPEKYLSQMSIAKGLMVGARFSRFIAEDEYWTWTKKRV